MSEAGKAILAVGFIGGCGLSEVLIFAHLTGHSVLHIVSLGYL